MCSLPFQLRYLLGYDRELCASVLNAFVKELSRSYRRRAKQAHAPLASARPKRAAGPSLGQGPFQVAFHMPEPPAVGKILVGSVHFHWPLMNLFWILS